MKAVVWIAVVGLIVGAASSAYAETAQDKMIAEMEKCTVCKYMAEKPELLKDMVWETHKIENGMLCLTTVPKEMKDEFAAVNAKMMQAIEGVKAETEQGKEVELCHFCSSMGELMKLDAKEQHLETATGAIHLFTSDDPAVVAKLHEFADKAIEEQKKMKEQQQQTASLQ